jgi:hypothetical protein
MRKLHYYLRGHTMAAHDALILVGDEVQPTGEDLAEAVMDTISTELMVTVGEVTMHLAAWADPDHWSDDWREELGLDDPDEAPEAVAQLLAAGVAVT